jgi:hypothetical protein
MRFNVVHHGRKWPRVENHLDNRRCPDCKATVHGWAGQRGHQDYHDETNALLEELCKRVGLTEEDFEGRSTWSAVVESGDGPGELEAAE